MQMDDCSTGQRACRLAPPARYSTDGVGAVGDPFGRNDSGHDSVVGPAGGDPLQFAFVRLDQGPHRSHGDPIFSCQWVRYGPSFDGFGLASGILHIVSYYVRSSAVLNL
jgi:hypothetical protein